MAAARQHGAASSRTSWDALLIFSVPSNYSCLSLSLPCLNGRDIDMTIRECQVQGREDGSDSHPARHEATTFGIGYSNFFGLSSSRQQLSASATSISSHSLHPARHEATTFSIGYSNFFGQTQLDFTGSTQPLQITSSAIHLRSRINSSIDD